MGVAINTKRQLLLDLCVDALEAHGVPSDLHYEQRYRRQTEPRTARRDRTKLMGEHCFYLEVLRKGPFNRTVKFGDGSVQGIDYFQVTLFKQYEDDWAYATSSQKTFDDLCYSESSSTPGLLPKLRRTERIGAGSDRCRLEDPEDDVEDVVPLDDTATETAHQLTFTIGVEG